MRRAELALSYAPSRVGTVLRAGLSWHLLPLRRRYVLYIVTLWLYKIFFPQLLFSLQNPSLSVSDNTFITLKILSNGIIEGSTTLILPGFRTFKIHIIV